MHDLTKRIADSRDAFLVVVEMPALYRSSAEFERVVGELSRISTDHPSVSARVRLGVLYAKRAFSTDTYADMQHELAQLRNEIGDDFALTTLWRFVEAVLRLMRGQQFDEALRDLCTLESEIRLRDCGELYGLVRRWVAIGAMFVGKHAEARIAFEDALSSFRRYGMKCSHAATLSDYGFLNVSLANYIEVRNMLREALAVFDDLGMSRNKVMALTNLGLAHERLGNWNAAQRCYCNAISLFELDIEPGDKFTPLHVPCLTNIEYMQILRRQFVPAEQALGQILARFGSELADRLRAIAHEYLAELYIEQSRLADAETNLRIAEQCADGVLGRSDVMTEILRRRAMLQFAMGRLDEVKSTAIECVRLCRRLGDRYELGAVLRVLGQAYAAEGQEKRARGCFRASASILKSIQECYELMRTLYAQGKFFAAQGRKEDAEVSLLEARQLAKKLELDYYLALIAIALMDVLGPQERFDEANGWLAEATALRDNLEGIDRDRVEEELKRAAEELQTSMTRASVRSAETLKTICRVYEDARFPFEDLKPDLAYQVAQSVGGECLFIIARFGGGYRVPLTYNIAVNEAKEVVRQIDRGSRKVPLLGVDGEPRVLRTLNNKTLVAVPCQHEESLRRDATTYLLCARFDDIVTVTPRQLELLCASGEALARLIEVEEERRGHPVGETDEEAIKIKHPRGSFKDILTIDADMIKVIRMAERAAGSVAPILLEGETGVGKELFARAIHESSKRSECPFVAINAGGLSVHLIESELFGHVKGAFTGANTDRIGFIETARGGTLFLDEIGEMSEELQVKLLRLLENGEYRRLGESTMRKADVRVISATNRDLKAEVDQAAFRRDLYYRVSPIKLTIPPLRMRSRDIQLLVRHFLRECAALNGIPDRYIEIDVKAMEALELYDWPGNVRELYNEILRVVSLIGRGDIVKFAMLSDSIKDYLKSKSRGDGLLDRSVEQYERRLILRALDRNDWNRMRTADSVGVPRTTLLAKLKRLNVASKDHPASP